MPRAHTGRSWREEVALGAEEGVGFSELPEDREERRRKWWTFDPKARDSHLGNKLLLSHSGSRLSPKATWAGYWGGAGRQLWQC